MSDTNGNQFKGTIKLDIRDSKPDWNAFLYKKAPKDAPNVLVILYDDTGCASWSPYGGRINMPTLDRLAANGLTYSQWHTTAVCSPTRSCFLTGRNHHANGFGSISEMAVGFPGYCGHIPPENGTIAQILRDAGWSTFWIGKNHNVPVDAFSIGATKKKWPLGLGYDRFYGFIGGETNQWYPTLIDKLGSPDTYNHYPTGWAVAFSTPYKMFKRYSSYAGGTCDPLVIHWPKGIKAKGEVRHQYHHCTDIVPTILECCGIEMPETVDGTKQAPLAGVSMRYSFDNAAVSTRKETQYYEMVGTRGIWHNGWKASTLHAPMPSNQGNFDKDVWQLFNVEDDRSEMHDLAAQHPDKLKQLQDLWTTEAEKNNVFPLIDVGVDVVHELEFHAAPPASGRYVYYPGTTEVPEATAARTLASSWKALAEVEFTGQTQGVIFAQGSRFGGYSLFVKDGRIFFVYNFLGVSPEQRLTVAAPALGTHIVGVEFVKKSISPKLETLGQMKLYLDDKVVAEGPFRTQSGHYALCGEGLSIGIDTGDSVSSEYKPNFELSGGRVVKVVFDVAKDAYVDVEKAMAASMARD